MSENAELVRRTNDAFNRGDLEGVVALTGPEIQIEDLPDMPEARSFHGHDGLKEFLGLNTEPWESVKVEIDRLIDVGDDAVVVLSRAVARGRGSGVEINQPRGSIYTVRGGKIVRVQFFASPAQTLEAAGLGAELS